MSPRGTFSVAVAGVARPPVADARELQAHARVHAVAVEAERKGIPLRVFKVDEYGAPHYPELILTTTRKVIEDEPELVESIVDATRHGYEFTEEEPKRALGDLLAANKSLEAADQEAQLKVLLPELKPAPFDKAVLDEWSAWASEHELLPKPANVAKTFDLGS